MPKQVILMVGLHKTGTTSIQQTCMASLPALSAADFAYPVHTTEAGPNSNHGLILKVAFRGSLDRYGLSGQIGNGVDEEFLSSERRRVRGQFDALLADLQGSVILAAENISLFGEEELRQMRLWFEGRGWKVRVICHVRHLSSWIHSMVAQRVTGGLRIPIAAAVEEFVALGGMVRPRIERLQSALPEVEFHSHERAVRHANGPPGYFLDTIGVPPAGIRFHRANEGSSGIATRLLSIINEKFVRFPGSGIAAPTLLDRETQAIRNLPGPKFRLGQDEAEPLLSLIESERRWLAEQLGSEFAGPPMQWDGPSVPISTESVQAALAALPPEVNEWLLANRHRWS